MEEAERKRIGQRLQDAREKAGLTQPELADVLGYKDARSVRYWEAGNRLGGFFRRLDDICAATNQPREWFIGEGTSEANIEQLQRDVDYLKGLMRRHFPDEPGDTPPVPRA